MISRTAPGAIPHAATTTLLAVIRCHARDGRATVRSVAAERGRSISSTHRQLERLRWEGLVDWQDGAAATLHPLAAPAERAVAPLVARVA